MTQARRRCEGAISIHVICRGHNHMTIFGARRDYTTFLSLLEAAARESAFSVHAFVLMSTHVHALITPSDIAAMSSAMHTIDSTYSRYFNRTYGRVGTLWIGRYHAKPVFDAHYWINCLRYIEQNPVRAHMVTCPADYEWSSYRVNAGTEERTWLVEHPVYLALGPTPEARQQAYRAICGVPLDASDVRLQRRRPRRPTLPMSPAEIASKPFEYFVPKVVRHRLPGTMPGTMPGSDDGQR